MKICRRRASCSQPTLGLRYSRLCCITGSANGTPKRTYLIALEIDGRQKNISRKWAIIWLILVKFIIISRMHWFVRLCMPSRAVRIIKGKITRKIWNILLKRSFWQNRNRRLQTGSLSISTDAMPNAKIERIKHSVKEKEGTNIRMLANQANRAEQELATLWRLRGLAAKMAARWQKICWRVHLCTGLSLEDVTRLNEPG